VAVSYAGATREQYASALNGLWSDLNGALARLERIAAEPEAFDDDLADVLPVLQYSLHRAAEAIHGLPPLPVAAEAHRELAGSLEEARDVTAEVAWLLEAGEYETARELVHEWRGALFRVRLARRRLTRTPLPLPVEVDEPRATAVAAVALALLAAGTTAFLAGAVLVMWPLWAAGLGVVAASLLVFRP
jgi:hypothetical protein